MIWKILAFSDTFLMVFPLAVVRSKMALIVACTECFTFLLPCYTFTEFIKPQSTYMGKKVQFLYSDDKTTLGILGTTDTGCGLHLITSGYFFKVHE